MTSVTGNAGPAPPGFRGMLRPGGRLALSDLTADPGRLARSLRGALPGALRGRVDDGMALTAAARRAVDHGELGYGMLVARRDGHL